MQRYDSYKDSGVQWLGEIPSHWEVKKIRHLFSLSNQKTTSNGGNLLSLSQYTGVSQKNDDSTVHASEDTTGYNIVKKGQLVMNIMLTWNGSYAVSEYDGIISPAYCVFDFTRECVKSYFNYLLRLKVYAGAFKTESKGIIESRLRLYPQYFKNFPLIIPPLDEQRAMAEYLDEKTAEIDKAIERQQRIIDLLNERRQIIIQRAVTRGLNPDAPMKDSGVDWIGEIPEHWEVKRIKYIFFETEERNRDLKYQLLSFSRKLGIVPFSEINDKPHSALDLTPYKVIHKDELLENRMQAWTGMFAKANIEGCVSPDYSVFRKFNSNDSTEYFALLFQTPMFVEQFANASKGIGEGFNRLYTPQFGKIISIYPPSDEQHKIAESIKSLIGNIDSSIKSGEQMIDLLQERKQILISEIVTGKIKVS